MTCVIGSCDREAKLPTSLGVMEHAIAADLEQHLGAPVTTRCYGLMMCIARLPDGATLPIHFLPTTTGQWEWRVTGLVITTNQLEAHLRDEVADLGVPQGVRCTPRIRQLSAGERVECWFERGGKAFVTVRGDGSTSIEILLDEASSRARSEVVTPAMDADLLRISRDLERDESDDGEDPIVDAPDPR